MTVQNPHDRFFRESFTRPEIVRNYLEEYLPADLRALIDLEQLHLEDGSFIDEAMREHQTDLLYRVVLADDTAVYIYFLFEHKSYPDPLTPLQLLRYMVRFWERQVKEQERLSPIIPLVIYHGEQRWSVAADFLTLLDAPPPLRPYLPDFRYHLNDFSYLSDETIRGKIWLRVCLATLRSIFNPHLRAELGDLVHLLFQLEDQETGLEYIRTILYYMSRATERVSREDMRAALLQQDAAGEQMMTTIAQEFIEQGIEQGIERGQIQTLQEEILALLNIRFGLASERVAERVTAVTDVAALRQLLHQAAIAETADHFRRTLARLSEQG